MRERLSGELKLLSARTATTSSAVFLTTSRGLSVPATGAAAIIPLATTPSSRRLLLLIRLIIIDVFLTANRTVIDERFASLPVCIADEHVVVQRSFLGILHFLEQHRSRIDDVDHGEGQGDDPPHKQREHRERDIDEAPDQIAWIQRTPD